MMRSLEFRYVRLELLEGVAAFYSGNKVLARAKLKSSEQRWQQLQVSDGNLAELMSMGFKSHEVCPANIPCKVLKLCGIKAARSAHPLVYKQDSEDVPPEAERAWQS